MPASRHHLHRCDDQRSLRRRAASARLAELQPDVVGTTAITPSIYKAEEVLKHRLRSRAARRARARRHPRHLHVQAGALRSALDRRHRARRGRGDLPRADPRDRCGPLARRAGQDQGPCLRRWRPDRRHAGRGHGQGSRCDQSRLVAARMVEIHLRAARRARRDPQHGARLPLHLLVLLAVEVLARLPRPQPGQGGRRDREAGQRARRRLLHPGRRGTDDQPQEIHPASARS